MALELNGFIADGQDSQIYTAEGFSELRLSEIKAGELSAAQFGIRAYPNDQEFRAVTMGLDKFGQYNFVIPAFEGEQMMAVGSLMDLVSQYFIESEIKIGPGPITLEVSKLKNKSVKAQFEQDREPGSKGKVILNLEVIAPVSGDPEYLLGPVFDGDPVEGLETILIDLFGYGRANSSKGVDYDELEVYMAAAQERAVALLADFDSLQLSGQRISLAVQFVEQKRVSWAEVIEWNGKRGKGIMITGSTADYPDREIDITSDVIVDFRLYDKSGVIESGGVDEMVRRKYQ